jgi:16S rRNA (cytosine1402-N4)-methyltransferase
MKNNKYHEPVMVGEVLDYLKLDAPLERRKKYIDATVSTGGYSLEILKKGGEVLGIDFDPEILEVAKKRLEACPTPDNDIGGRFQLTQGNFKDIKKIALENGFKSVNGIVYDLGVSNLQLTSTTRGFSFAEENAPLDMRINKSDLSVKASDLLNGLREDQLEKLFQETLEFHNARRLAKLVIKTREEKPFYSVGDFLLTTKKVFNKKGRLHPATKAFLALRIAVNSELENVKESLPQAISLLGRGGRLVVVSFHSGEDAIVKNIFKKAEAERKVKIITKKPIFPTEEEIEKNAKSRSARLRAIEKI